MRLLDAIALVPEEILAEMAQLTKENSIEGCKAGRWMGEKSWMGWVPGNSPDVLFFVLLKMLGLKLGLDMIGILGRGDGGRGFVSSYTIGRQRSVTSSTRPFSI